MAAFASLIVPILWLFGLLIPLWLAGLAWKAFVQIIKVRIATRWSHMQYNSIRDAWKKDNIDE